MNILDETNTGEKFKPTVEWMSEMYNKANRELFGGQLGECIFKAEPIKSNTNWLGSFCVDGKNLFVRRTTRRMLIKNYWGVETFVTRENFFNLCRPTITLSTYYSGTNESLYVTLVHEMCHYYTYMNGYCPKQGHGPEFRNIGTIVSYRSNGLLTVERIANAEVMSGYDVDDEIKQRRENRRNNKILNMSYLVIKPKTGNIRLVSTTIQRVIDSILSVERDRGSDIYLITNYDIKTELFNAGYNVSSKKYSYYPVTSDKKGFEIINKAFSEGYCKQIL